MDPISQVVPDQLPDEKYIERLFPKCLPKQNTAQLGGKRSNFRDYQKRQNKPKVHQHSRRELEARRSKNKSSATNNNSNNNNVTSDSSDENSSSHNNASLIKKSISIHGYGSSKNSTVSSSSSSRRTGKYMASQSLLQQLQRSQSTYSNNNNSNTSAQLQTLDLNSASACNVDTVTNSEQVPKKTFKHDKGIVKSNSNYSMPEEPFVNSSRYHTLNQTIKFTAREFEAPNTHLQQHQIIPNKLPPEIQHKTDNTQSDLLDNKLITAFESSETKTSSSISRDFNHKDILSNNINNTVTADIIQPKCLDEAGNSNNSHRKSNEDDLSTSAAGRDDDLVKPIETLINKIDRRNFRVRYSFDLEDNYENILSSETGSSICAPMKANSSSSQTADFDHRAKSENTLASRVTSEDLISIDRSDGQATDLIEPEQINLDENLLSKRQDVHYTIPGSFPKDTGNGDDDDDDNCINLYLQDNVSHRQQKPLKLKAHVSTPDKRIIQDLSSKTQTPKYNVVAIDKRATPSHPDINKLVDHDGLKSGSTEIANELIKENLVTTEHQQAINLPISTPDQSIVSRYRKELESSTNIVSIQHSAGQQLLASDINDNEENVISNDASVEELCNMSDTTSTSDTTSNQLNDLNINNCNNSCGKGANHKPRPLLNSFLQTVDEKAENIIEENSKVHKYDKTDSRRASDMMPIVQVTNLTKKPCAPPGYPKRIVSSASSDENQVQQLDSPDREIKLSIVSPSDSDLISGQHRNVDMIETKTELGQRVKFDEQNLVIVKDENGLQTQNSNTKQCLVTRRTEHQPQMPSISEANYESDVDSVNELNRNEFGSDSIPELSTGLNKISLSNFSFDQETMYDTGFRNPTTESFNQESTYSLSTELQRSQDNNSIDQLPETSLRQYKLPNETSHYSTLRSNIAVSVNNTDPNFPSRSSSLQFNTLSDGESGADDQSNPMHKSTNTTKGRDSNNTDNNCNLTISSTFSKNEDDLTPITKTALIFPRLDEGLSSEAESCEEEPEDDEEKAVDADVDADDDEDEDEDEDEDDDEEVENETIPLERNGQVVHLGLSSVDSFLRPNSQQPQKTQLRLISLQQQQPHVTMTLDQTDSQQIKSSGYMTQNSLDHNNIRSTTNYANLNGNQSNYCVNIPNQHSSMSPQPSSSQQYNQPSQSHNNNLVVKQNPFNREEAKPTNRPSSDTDNETDRLLGTQRNDQLKQLTISDVNNSNSTELQPILKQTINSKEVLIEGVLFSVRYLGSTHTDCEGRGEKEDRIHQAELAVHEVKFRNGDSHTPLEVHLFISTEKIMVLDQRNRKIMMDHSLRTISYIADIGDAIVLIVRKKNNVLNELGEIKYEGGRPAVTSKISCHVFESSESHTITKSISQAFQVAYTELLKANSSGDTSSYLPKELDYQEVLNSQEMSTDELEMFARKENQREVIVPKERGEILGLSIVESGWGSVLPTVVIANLKHDGPAYRCKKLSVGDQILSINGISLVGLPLADCQEILRKTKNQRVARLSVVPCPITVEVKIKRPDTKYQLGFSVQNGVICSLLRGGIAERGGVRVGHRIMSINGTTVVNVPHEKIVSLLASSVGEIKMKTCLTSLYRLILGEENPVHF